MFKLLLDCVDVGGDASSVAVIATVLASMSNGVAPDKLSSSYWRQFDLTLAGRYPVSGGNLRWQA
ncbi:hypothetical protein ACO0LG_02245 [Undibacterium sp. Ji42W]|uniref:hypothetical protein n=1 Tax=Undibacterium sp. Ji42W TaxID=3413039 RepID=UPI003BF156FA